MKPKRVAPKPVVNLDLNARREMAFIAAMHELEPDEKNRMVLVYFDGETIIARRAGAAAVGTHVGQWVDVGALLGKGGDAGGVDEGVERALNALWPEADQATRRAMRIVANMAARFGGLF